MKWLTNIVILHGHDCLNDSNNKKDPNYLVGLRNKERQGYATGPAELKMSYKKNKLTVASREMNEREIRQLKWKESLSFITRTGISLNHQPILRELRRTGSIRYLLYRLLSG